MVSASGGSANITVVSNNKIGPYKNGSVLVCGRTRVQILCGHRTLRSFDVATFDSNFDAKQTPCTEVGSRSPDSGVERMPVGPSGDPRNIVIVYAGVSAYQETLARMRAVKTESPRTMVIVVTCDCDAHNKFPHLHALVQEQHLDDYVVIPECGGKTSMERIVTAIKHRSV